MPTWRYGLIKYKVRGYNMLSIGEIYLDENGVCTMTTDEEFAPMFERCLDEYSDCKNPEKKAKKEILKDLKRMTKATKAYPAVTMKQDFADEKEDDSLSLLTHKEIRHLLKEIKTIAHSADYSSSTDHELAKNYSCCNELISEGHNTCCKIGKIVKLTNFML